MKEQTAMQELIEWLDIEIIINPYYRASPRLTEGAMMAKVKATQLLTKERERMIKFGEKMQIIDDIDFDGNVKFSFNPQTYFTTTYKQP